MKLLVAIMSKEDREITSKRLIDEGFMLTELGSTGGFLKKKNITILIGVPADKVSRAKEILKESAGKRALHMYQPKTGALDAVSKAPPLPIDTIVGGCTVFELDTSSMSKF